MSNYKRILIPGGTFFFTVAIAHRKSRLLTNHIDHLRAAFASVRAERPFEIEAIVILPDHLHCIWRLPEGDADYATRWRIIKSRFSKKIQSMQPISASRLARGERSVWQRRYWEHAIRDDRDFRAHVDYIHFNPVKHGHAQRVQDWPHSSFHRFVADGRLPADWGGEVDLMERGEFGE